MIVVRIELWPYGRQENAKLLGVCSISNDGSGDEQFGNYNVELSHAGKHIQKRATWKRGTVKCYKRALSPYHLVYEAIRACLWPKRN